MLRENFLKFIDKKKEKAHDEYVWKRFSKEFDKFIEKKEFTKNDCQELLETLSNYCIKYEYRIDDILEYFPHYYPIILSMTIPIDSSGSPSRPGDTISHEKKCVLLGYSVALHPDVLGHTLRYFENHPAPFESLPEDPGHLRKRQKLDTDASSSQKSSEPTDEEIVRATYRILKASPTHFKRKWNWSKFYHYLDNNTDVRYLALKCLGIVLDMSEKSLMSCVRSLIPNYSQDTAELVLGHDPDVPALLIDDYDVKGVEECLEGSSSLVSIAGVLLPIFNKDQPPQSLNLIPVPSMESNLRSLALAVASRKAVCLQGPVGCGKTALVEYLAKKTGRGPSDMIKVQLGDQTDSKMLLGTYRCTDIPGEFVWQPGVLTQAVLSGKWLLLEDIDSAALDVASVLSSLMETGTLSVPGYRDTIYAKSGFQLFVTQRLITTITGVVRQSSGASGLLEKHWLCVHMDPLSKEELVTVVQTLFPDLSTVATRIVDVFLLFSSGNHQDRDGNLSRNTGRLLSTRDLIKWCTRAIVNYEVSSPESALKVLQDAIDIFCCSVPDEVLRLKLAVNIGNTLGIISTRTEYFVKEHKPSVSIETETLVAGRARINRKSARTVQLDENKVNFSFTRPSASLLERVTTCVAHKEPVLLVGETGTGKTSSVQFLARSTGHKLIVINMNQQSESADLLGGYKPVDIKLLITPIREEFEILFRSFFAIDPNKKFLEYIAVTYRDGKWKTLVSLMTHSAAAAIARLRTEGRGKKSAAFGKRGRGVSKERQNSKYDTELLIRWERLAIKLEKLKSQVKTEFSLAFAFIEGSLIKALQEGHWVLLDEINLASSETLECLSGLLEGSSGSLSLLERGDNESIKRHPDFTMFACMNPATDVGKKELPVGLRNRFTEFYVDELTEKTDLQLLVSSYLDGLNLPSNKVESIVNFYLKVRNEAMNSLNDGTGHKPHFSLRTLCRALSVASQNPCGNVLRSLYEAFCLSFLTQLDQNSYPVVQGLIAQLILDKDTMKGTLKAPIPKPRCGSDEDYINFEGYWVIKGTLEPETPGNYILTNSVRQNLKDLVRIVSIGKMPVLLQGDTSVGKTSLITYLAKSSGHVCVRINNHEHTDLQEYVGSYVASDTGKLVFKEGILVEAMRKGYWIILDELNLAPSDVLEALNRVLDDNRELFIPETQQTVKAHANFMLFATQNPPGVYGGRKVLSRAFRNRFVELHFDEIPPAELRVILHERCHMPESYCKQIINVMTDLQIRRKSTAAFSGKHGFITLRDLFRWGERFRLARGPAEGLYDWSQHLADEGYLVLSAKVRKPEEAEEIRQVIKKHLKRDVDPQTLFSLSDNTSSVTKPILEDILNKKIPGFEHIVWTYHMRRMAVLVSKSCQFKEPVLLVGETGGGKTTVCQLAAAMREKHLHSVNCHMHTESSDFLGNLRPVRDHSDRDNQKLFEWVDGPLITAMRAGDIFLADEISLADDSVLERMNSLLEPERSLLLAEKSTDSNVDSNELNSVITAHEDFCFIGTMNPGGDYGKKELSPALRNRFTEIWCEGCTENSDLQVIIEHNLVSRPHIDNQTIAEAIIEFLDWLRSSEVGKRFSVSIRDVLTWVDFMNSSSNLSTSEIYYHGACLTYIDSLGSGVTGTESFEKLETFRRIAIDFLKHQIRQRFERADENFIQTDTDQDSEEFFGVTPFYIPVGPSGKSDDVGFTFTAPTTNENTLKVLRALQLKKPLLLEGSPGVGKTSLVSAIAKASGHCLLRINLSDQTDVSDLFGADLPLEGGKGGQFAWKDGPFLRALRAGDWILLDELNLASQSVLEGLNACLDHRGEVYIPELGKTFAVKPGTKLFGCQNPLRQGGARRGLPKSFLNRFTQVFVDALSDDDLRIITQSQFPELGEELVGKIIKFNSRVSSEAGVSWGYYGAPWEMNLRDITRLCELICSDMKKSTMEKSLVAAATLIYSDRLRCIDDKCFLWKIYKEIFGRHEGINFWDGKQPLMNVTDEHLYLDNVAVERTDKSYFENHNLLVMRSQMPALKSLGYCVNMNWMPILVGPSGAGKSSVVRVLAQLTGQKLRSIVVNSAMDTTEILGGFEQTDYNRHLEQLISDTEDLLINSITEGLSNGVQILADLHGQLEAVQCSCCDENLPKTMAMEIDIFLQRIEKLLKLILTMKSDESTHNTELTEIETKLENLSAVVKEDKCLNAGGKFEWIDSVLVKCLQDGTWLLVDQVNLCSPAVLDRLNGLLEPNGVLTIGERGTDTSGNVHTIKPHPNFRLFLTMDPHYSEISRAMRNRGVEIYLQAHHDHGFNPLDMKSQLHTLGMVRDNHQKALLDIHRKMSEGLCGGEKPGINQLLHTASLIVHQVNRGFPVRNAFLTSCTDVYIKSRYVHDPILKQVLLQKIEASIASHDVTKDQPSCFDLSEMTPNIHDFLNDAGQCLIKQQNTNMQAICNKLTEWFDGDQNEDLSTDFLTEFYFPPRDRIGADRREISRENSPVAKEVFLHFLINFFERASVEDFQKRIDFFMDKHFSSLGSLYTHLNDKLKQLKTIIDDSAESLPSSSLPWHPLTSPCEFTPEQLQLTLKISLMTHMKIYLAEASIPNGLKRYYSEVTVEGFSRALIEELVPYRECSVLVILFTPVAEMLSQWIQTYILEVLDNLSWRDCINLRRNIMSIRRFYDQGKQVLYYTPRSPYYSKDNQERISNIERSLEVHYQWMMKFVGRTIEESRGIDRHEVKQTSENLRGMLRDVTLNLHSDNDGFRQLAKIIRQQMKFLPPYNSAEIIINHQRLHTIITQFSPIREIALSAPLAWKLRLMIIEMKECVELRESLIKTWQDIFISQNYLETGDVISAVEDLSTDRELSLGTPDKMSQALDYVLSSKTEKELNESVLKIQMLPIHEYLFFLLTNKLHKLVCGKIINPDSQLVPRDTLSKFIKIPSIPIDLIAVLDALHMQGNKISSSLVSELFCQLEKFRHNSLAFREPEAVLNFSGVSPDDADATGIPDFDEANFVQYSILQPTLIILLANAIFNKTYKGETSVIKMARLGTLKEKTRQLKLLNETIWKNSIAINSKEYEFHANDFKALVAYATNYLKAIANVGDDETARAIITSPRVNLVPIAFRYEIEYLNPLQQLRDFVESSQEREPESYRAIELGMMWTRLGVHELFMFVHLELIDPVEKVDLKIKFAVDCIEDLRNMMYSIHLDGQVLGESSIRDCDPRVVEARKALDKLYIEKEDLLETKGFRGPNAKYFDLLQRLDGFKGIFDEPATVLGPAVDLYNTLFTEENIPRRNVRDVIGEATDSINTIQGQYRSLHGFSSILRQDYLANYRELVQPILISLAHLEHGMKILIDEGTRLLSERQSSFDLSSTAESFLYSIVRFPTVGYQQENLLQLIDLATCTSTREFIDSKIDTMGLGRGVAMIEVFRTLKNSLSELYNQTSLTGKVTPEIWQVLNKLLLQIVLIWQKKEIEGDRRRQQEDSLYRNKTKTQGQMLTEEEEINNELRELFPTHRDDFKEIDESQPTLEARDSVQETREDQEEAIFEHLMTDEDIHQVYEIHSKLVQHFVPAPWLQGPDETPKRNYIDPLLERFKTFNTLLPSVQSALPSDLSPRLYMSFNVMTSVAACQSQGVAFIEESSFTNKPYDFYKSPNIEMVKQCLPALDATLIRVNNLLKDWPEHPTLSTIRAIITRINSFTIDSPVSRFLTGLELLLVKMREWEENAHSGVSLAEHSTAVIQQIIDWRRLELNCWKSCLETAFDRLKAKASKWWFLLFGVVQSYLNKSVDREELQEASASSEDEEVITAEKLIERLETFMNQSPLVEFQGRLDLLYTFHSHVYCVSPGSERDELLAIFWNIYNYYSQFSKEVQNRINSLKSPIEKKLEDFVKIARWNDINYWSVKETVEKTHRTLYKFIREYESGLKQNVGVCLLVKPSNYDLESNRGEWEHSRDREYTIDPRDFITTLVLNERTTLQVQNDLINRSSSLFTKSKVLCLEIITKSVYPALRSELEQFIEDSMADAIHLKSLEVDRTLPKPKQKSHAKSILQQKRMALADYFKTLTNFGISYRRGLLALKNRPNDIMNFTVPPLEVSLALKRFDDLKKIDQQVLAQWNGCQSYYYKSLIKLNALNSAFMKVQTDLGVKNMERCSGYSNHLMLMVHNEKKILAENFNTFLILKQHISGLMRIDGEDVDLPVGEEISVCSSRLKDLLVFLQINFEQLGIYLHSCPRDAEDNSNILLLESNDIPMINSTKDDHLWRSAESILKSCADIVATELKKHEKIFSQSSPTVIRTAVHYNFLGIGRESLQKIRYIISNFVRLFTTNHPIMETIKYIEAKIERWILSFKNLKVIQNTTVDPGDVGMIEFSDNAEALIKTVLLVIQDKYKETSSTENDESSDTNAVAQQREGEEEVERSQLEENGLREKLIESLEKDITNLRLTDVNNKVEEMLELSQKLKPSFSSQTNLILRRCLSILNQYLSFSQFYLHEQVALFRTSCKFLYIQLNVFLDLATNGFCVPKDLDLDDADDGDDGEQRDSEKGGMGLADGEGKKDVSDRIESEDQLDDARPAGEEQESKEDNDCKEEENGIDMSENFESKLQDLDKKDDEEDDDEEKDDDDLDKEMGDTEEGTDHLDKEIWGDDVEQEDETNDTDEQGSGEQVGEKEMTAKDEKSKDPNEDDQNRDNREESEEEKKEINEMNEPDVNDDQINPYHGNQEPQPEPEAMDLPEDLNLDEGEGKEDNSEGEENPFDIDAMKESMPPPEEKEPDKSEGEEKKGDEGQDDDSSDDDDNGPSASDPQVKDLDENEEENHEEGSNQVPEGSKDEEPEDNEKSSEEQVAPSMDDASTETDAAQESTANVDGSHDKVPDKENQNDKQESSSTENHEDDGEDKGTGQAQSEAPEHGHVGASTQKDTPVQRQMEQKPQEKRKKPGESDDNRALVDNIQPDLKKQKMIHSREESSQNNEDEGAEEDKDGEIDMCQHVKESEKYDNYATDAATEEQAKKQKTADTEDDGDKPEDPMDVDMHEDEVLGEDKSKPLTQKPEETFESDKDKDKEKSKTSSKGQTLEDAQMESQVEVEGEDVDTLGVQRAAESAFFTNLIEDSSIKRIEQKRREIENMLSQWTSPPTTEEALTAWNSLCAVTETSARDLSEKLRLVLEPTQATRLKGDYRTGKRINMRKIIPYIASQFRKDKIWLRRTKPSKRDYQIVLALDDSSSMADNHSKELAFESLSLISKAMGYLEVGDLSVLSFGETPKVLHPLGTPFNEQSGARLIQEMKFDQKNTKIAELVDFTVDMFEGQRTATDNAKLLLILSDGRGFSSHGLNQVVRAVRRAKLNDIFLVFIIVENPNGKDSILDIRNAVFENGKVIFRPYLDSFPFPFYMILKDINALPGVLSDALRQWFEVVGKIDT